MMFNIHVGMHGYRQPPQSVIGSSRNSLEQPDQARLRHLSMAHQLTKQYAKLLRAHPTSMRLIWRASRLGLRSRTTVRTVRVPLHDSGHQQHVYLDAAGRYWIAAQRSTNSKVNNLYIKRRLEDFEMWELRSLIRVLRDRIDVMSRR